MNILIEGINLTDYYSKEHESFKTGMKTMFGAKCYGKGYPNYDEKITSFLDIKKMLFGEANLDLLILMGANCRGFKEGIGGSYNPEKVENGFYYSDIKKLDCKKAVMLYDFWSEAEAKRETYFNFVKENGIDYVISLFRAPFHLWRKYDIYEKLVWLPPSFMPNIFNDWGLEKKYDVGNLNAGIESRNGFYPERYDMHQRLLEMKDINYLYAKHPGSGFFTVDTPLIGRRFSEAINQCKLFVISGNLEYKNFTSKYVEVMASKTAIFTTECLDAHLLGIEDGKNCVYINSNNFEDKISYYLKHEDELSNIAENGYILAMEKYSCYAQAAYMYREFSNRMKKKGVDKKWK